MSSIFNLFVLTAGILVFSSRCFAQQKGMSYSIINKGDTVGQMQLTQRTANDNIYFNVVSLVQTRMLMNIKVSIQEEAHYRKGKLISSSSKRFVNDKPRGDKQTQAGSDCYTIMDGGRQQKLMVKSISCDFSMMYVTEPVGTKEVYSNYYQKMLSIQPLAPHSYQINLPEGGSNVYYYVNGVCNRVDVRNTLYNTQMILNK